MDAPVVRAPGERDLVCTLEGATWADYQRLLELRGERPVPRLAYLAGRLEIMSPSRSHERIKSMLGRLLEAWCLERGVPISAYGSWLLERKDLARGIEPDECYVLGETPDASDESGPDVPDLAIEVVWTSGGIDKLDVYHGLGVREVWYWQDDGLRIFARRDGRYEPLECSELIEGLDPALLLRFVDVRPMTRAISELRQALRDD